MEDELVHATAEWNGAPDVEAENLVDAFVELFNARDLDGIAELLSPEVGSDFFSGVSRQEVLDGISDFVLRYPTLILTRGELDDEPVAAAWIVSGDEYQLAGYFDFVFTDGDEEEELVERLEYVDASETELDRLLLEEPEPEEIAEWEDWSEWDDGA